ncbi:hypothetical protein EON62_00875 [archaeon]|nr:MAG: hypothetical protein EON62_00875 [archaeon]
MLLHALCLKSSVLDDRATQQDLIHLIYHMGQDATGHDAAAVGAPTSDAAGVSVTAASVNGSVSASSGPGAAADNAVVQPDPDSTLCR